MDTQTICRHCKKIVLTTDFFCPNCGKKLKEKPLPTDLVVQILIYIFSIFFAPLGIWPAVRYLKQNDKKSKNIGIIIIILTIISFVIIALITRNIITNATRDLNQQLNGYQGIYY
ncbi:hypothetical protein A2V49_03825 [candidate division WWE3 bacterium RBG_19FT_COMBO_34_6]|uniref:Zinc-ribbon domain-containing protein n=1 Tax=candidate division WWE3 bacterium RBG_19FT_COMBO_34_6 TaxID=1802612 RepID=A0A1F4UKV9_UNCKA|nr:MAG: hypothetical protein A2V49_03825 [candidate division WWE3 bacterium RBG_19FT_COMBO_34_6]